MKHLKILAVLNSNLNSKNNMLNGIDNFQILLFLMKTLVYLAKSRLFVNRVHFFTATVRKILENFMFRVEGIQEMTVYKKSMK